MSENEAGSILGNLQAKRRQLDQREPLELAIPGYGGELVAVYQPLEWSVVNKLIHRVVGSNDELVELLAAADLLAQACVDVKILSGDGLKPISEVANDVEDGTPVRYDDNLAKAVGVTDQVDPAHPARSTVIAVFGNDFAVVAHQNQVVNWIRSGGMRVDEDF